MNLAYADGSMCGIAGEFVYSGARPAAVEVAAEMASRLAHRGPDGWGVYLDQTRQSLLLHTRLAIVDLAGGRQPLSNEAGDVWTVVNGELYDHARQRAGLEARGHVFRTRSDSEIVVHLYEEYGAEFVTHLRGEFALAVFDARRRTLLLARDRFGIKPLYYAWAGAAPGRAADALLFGSEIKALLAHPGLTARLNSRAIHSMLSTIYPPRDTIVSGIYQLEPAMTLTVGPRSSQERGYWRMPRCVETGEQPDEAGLIEEFRARLFEAVRLRLQGDVEVGAYLSGGIDSASIASAAARLNGGRLKTFTIGFANPRYDEARQAESIAEAAGCEAHSRRIGPNELAPHLARSLWHSELPLMNGHGAAKFLLSALARRHVKVVLTGEGADELLLGYPQFRHQELLEARRAAPQDPAHRTGLARFLREERGSFGIWTTNGYPDEELAGRLHGATPYSLIRYGVTRRLQRVLLARSFQRQMRSSNPLADLAARIDPDDLAGLPPLLATQCLMFRTDLPVYILNTLGDRAEMAHSVEGRVPFLDHPLVEFVARLPLSLRTRDGCCKYVLREAVRGLIPEPIRLRKKQLFLSPSPEVLGLLGGPGSELADEYLSLRRTREIGVIAPVIMQAIRRLLPIVPRRSRLYGVLEGLLVFTLSLHLLEEMYVRRPDAWLHRFRAARPATDLAIPASGAWLCYVSPDGHPDSPATAVEPATVIPTATVTPPVTLTATATPPEAVTGSLASPAALTSA